MLTTIRDPQGQLVLVCEWWLTDDVGIQDWEHGRWVRVEQVEISQRCGDRLLIRHLIHLISVLAPTAIGAFWERREKDQQRTRPHWYSRDHLLQHGVTLKEVVF